MKLSGDSKAHEEHVVALKKKTLYPSLMFLLSDIKLQVRVQSHLPSTCCFYSTFFFLIYFRI